MYIRQEKNYRSLTATQQCFGLSGIPQDVAVEDNEVYVVVRGNYSYIEVFNQNQQRIRNIGYTQSNTYGISNMITFDQHSASGEGAENIQFYSPMAIAIRGGILYVVDTGNYCVQKITKANSFQSLVQEDQGRVSLAVPVVFALIMLGVCLYLIVATIE